MAERQKPRLIRAKVIDEKGKFLQFRTVRLDQVSTEGVQRSALTEEQRVQARSLWQRVGRFIHPGMTTTAWEDGFRYEPRPDEELRVWERIADTVDRAWAAGIGQTRRQLLSAVNSYVMQEVDIPANLPGFTDELMEKVKNVWAESAPPPTRLATHPAAETFTGPVYRCIDLFDQMNGRWQGRQNDLIDLVRAAGLVVAIAPDGSVIPLFGRERVEAILADGGAAINELAVGFTFDPADNSDDADALCAVMTVLKGSHCYR